MQFKVFTHTVTLNDSDIAYETSFEAGTLARDFRVESGHWTEVEQGLAGSIDQERAAACWHRGSFAGDIALRFRASTVAPCDRDINCYWSGAGNIYGEAPSDCYVGGLGGWWGYKHGLERYPEGGWLSLAGGRALAPGRVYEVMAGRLGNWQFLYLDSALVVEAFDPAPLPSDQFDRIGLATWASSVVFHTFTVYRLRDVEWGRDLTPE